MKLQAQLAAFGAFGLLAFSSVVHAQNSNPLSAGVSEFEYPSDGVVMGQGWNPFSERGTTASCVKVREVPIGTSSFSTGFEEVRSSYSLLKKRSIAAKVSGGYGGVSGSASASSSGSRKINTEFVNVLFTLNSNIAGTKAVGLPSESEINTNEIIRLISKNDFVSLPESSQVALIENFSGSTTRIELESEAGSNIHLTDHASDLLEAGKYGQFLNSCGSGFVSAIQRGTDVSILATYRSRNLSEQSEFKARLSASGYGASGSASISSSSDLTKFEGETTFKIFQTGGIPVGIPVNFSGIRTELSDLNKFVSNPSPYSVVITPYTALPEFRVGDEIPQPSALVRMANYHIALSDLFRILEGVVEDDLATLDPESDTRNYDRKILDAYGGIEAVTDLKDEVFADLQLIERGISACLNNALKCKEEEIVDAYETEIRKDISISEANKQVFSDASQSADASDRMIMSEAPIRAPDRMADLGRVFIDDFGNVSVPAQNDGVDDSKEQVKFFERSIASQNEQLTELESNDGDFPPEFFLKFYDYLLQTPLPKEFLSSKNPNTTEKVKVERLIKNAVFQGRLHPWRSFYCSNGYNDFMCVTESFLNDKFDESEALKALSASINVTTTKNRCDQPQYNNRLREIDKSRYRTHHKDRRRMRSEARARYCRDVIVDMTL